METVETSITKTFNCKTFRWKIFASFWFKVLLLTVQYKCSIESYVYYKRSSPNVLLKVLLLTFYGNCIVNILLNVLFHTFYLKFKCKRSIESCFANVSVQMFCWNSYYKHFIKSSIANVLLKVLLQMIYCKRLLKVLQQCSIESSIANIILTVLLQTSCCSISNVLFIYIANLLQTFL